MAIAAMLHPNRQLQSTAHHRQDGVGCSVAGLLSPNSLRDCGGALSWLKPCAMDDQDEIERLLILIAEGDRLAFRQLYDAVGGRFLSTARRILGDASRAEDAVQEAFLRVWRNAKQFDPARGVALAWLGRIARNAALDRIPREEERDASRIEDVDIAVLPVEPADAKLGNCLRQLPPNQGKAVILMYLHGLTHPELAERMNAPLGTVKSWVKRGAEALRKCLGR
jgi:RNA polymerase sigma-70 factor, ECF subfamily